MKRTPRLSDRNAATKRVFLRAQRASALFTFAPATSLPLTFQHANCGRELSNYVKTYALRTSCRVPSPPRTGPSGPLASLTQPPLSIPAVYFLLISSRATRAFAFDHLVSLLLTIPLFTYYRDFGHGVAVYLSMTFHDCTTETGLGLYRSRTAVLA